MALSLQADIQRFLQITFTVNPEPVIDYLVEGADGQIIDYLGFDPQQADAESEIHDPSATFDLWVRRPPLRTLTSVTVDGTLIPAASYAAYLEGEAKDGLIRRIDGSRWGGQLRGTVILYNGGYLVVPFPLRDASIRMVARAFQKGAEFAADGNTPGVRTIALAGSDSITWSEGADDVSKGALELTGVERGMISRYRRKWVA